MLQTLVRFRFHHWSNVLVNLHNGNRSLTLQCSGRCTGVSRRISLVRIPAPEKYSVGSMDAMTATHSAPAYCSISQSTSVPSGQRKSCKNLEGSWASNFFPLIPERVGNCTCTVQPLPNRLCLMIKAQPLPSPVFSYNNGNKVWLNTRV